MVVVTVGMDETIVGGDEGTLVEDGDSTVVEILCVEEVEGGVKNGDKLLIICCCF